MLEGLEISEISYKDSIQIENQTFRFDSEYFQKKLLKKISELKKIPHKNLEDITSIKGGKRLPLNTDFVDSGVRYIRAEDVRNSFVQYDSSPFISEEVHSEICAYQTSKNDVLLTIVGNSIGDIGIVKFDLDRCNLTENCVKIISNKMQPFLNDYLFLFLMSHYGQLQIQREKVGTAQPKLAIERIRKFLIPLSSQEFQEALSATLTTANSLLSKKNIAYTQAETILLETLGMADFTPSSEPVNIKSFKESFGVSGRLDAEYYQPKYDAFEIRLSKKNKIGYLGELLSINQRGKQPDYAEVGFPVVNSKHVRASGVVFDDNRLAAFDDKTLLIQHGDVLINGTGVGTIGRAVAYLQAHKAIPDNHVTILRTTKLNPIYLAVYLNSVAGQMQVDKYFKGSSGQIELYPADIAKFLVPLISDQEQQKIADLVQQSFALKAQSDHLLDVAKRAVEIAIEQDETAALAYIANEVKNGSE